jgi:hypothetical protein
MAAIAASSAAVAAANSAPTARPAIRRAFIGLG